MRGIQIVRITGCSLGLCALFALTGCSDEDLYKNPPVTRTARSAAPAAVGTVPSASEELLGKHGQATSMAEALGVAGGGPPGDRDYVQKADIYWKFNAIKANYDMGTVQKDLTKQLDKIEAQTLPLGEDKNKALIREILTYYREAAEAQKALADMAAAGVDAREIQWGLGRYGLERRLNPRSYLGTRPTVPSYPTGATRAAKNDLILSWEDRHHVSPEHMRTQAYVQANMRTQRLGGELGLLGRKANTPRSAVTVD